jgi:hypothetical protein
VGKKQTLSLTIRPPGQWHSFGFCVLIRIFHLQLGNESEIEKSEQINRFFMVYLLAFKLHS